MPRLNMAAARKKRPACYPECTKDERLKRYKQERANLGELNRLLRNEPRRLATVHASAKQPEFPPLQAPKSSPVSTDVDDDDEDGDASSVYSEASDDTRVVESNKRVGIYDDETAAKMYPHKRPSIQEETWYERQAWPYDIQRLDQLNQAPKHDQLREALDEFRRMHGDAYKEWMDDIIRNRPAVIKEQREQREAEYRDFLRYQYMQYRETQNDSDSLIRRSLDEYFDVPSDS